VRHNDTYSRSQCADESAASYERRSVSPEPRREVPPEARSRRSLATARARWPRATTRRRRWRAGRGRRAPARRRWPATGNPGLRRHRRPGDRELAATLEAAGPWWSGSSPRCGGGRHPPSSTRAPTTPAACARPQCGGHLSSDSPVSPAGGRRRAWVDACLARRCCAFPIDVGPPLAEQLWGEVGAVLTSATIPVRSAQRLRHRRKPPSTSSTWGAPSTTATTHCSTWRATCRPALAESEPAIHEELGRPHHEAPEGDPSAPVSRAAGHRCGGGGGGRAGSTRRSS